MGREVRRVPANWEHPKKNGNYIPLLGDNFSQRLAHWNMGKTKWAEGLRENITGTWVPLKKEDQKYTFEEWDGNKPKKEKYMPEWPAKQLTHYQMYETCTEGTPISPVMATPEELARWLTNNKASAFGDITATYKQWLNVCKGAWPPPQ
jgi:hypothetical protein